MTQASENMDHGNEIPPQDPRMQDDMTARMKARRKDCIDRYWKSNVRIMAVLLLIWAFAGLGCGVLLADFLNRFSLGGIPLGFWFAQQGSILVFVILVLVYAILLNRLDAKHHQELEALKNEQNEPGKP